MTTQYGDYYVDTGYGIDVQAVQYQLKKNADKLLLDTLATPSFKEEFADYCKAYGLDPNDPVSAQAFSDGYENENCDTGILALVRDILREKTGDDGFVLDYGFLYYRARIPETAEERNKMKTREEIRALIEEHLKPLLKDDTKLEFDDVANVEQIK